MKVYNNPRHAQHFILVNGVLSPVSVDEYRRWVAMHNAGNPAGMGDRQVAPVMIDAGMEARR
jgi:hypothetical protein